MALPAVPAAVKAAVAALSDEKGRTAVLSVLLSVAAVIFLPVLLVLSLLVLPAGGLSDLMPEDELALIYDLRGQYGLDQYLSDTDYLAAEGLDFSGISFSDGQTIVHYYNQLDQRWKDTVYGDSTIGRSGCGPTALAMAVSSLTDTTIDPVQMSTWAYQNGYKAVGNGSFLSLIPEGAEHFGLTVDYADRTQAQKLVDALAEGKLVIAIMTKGSFTQSGHFIVLRGVTEDGQILVADPASGSRSEQPWPLEIIMGETRQTSGTAGPFWLLS